MTLLKLNIIVDREDWTIWLTGGEEGRLGPTDCNISQLGGCVLSGHTDGGAGLGHRVT